MTKWKKTPSVRNVQMDPKRFGVPYLYGTKTLGVLKGSRHKTHPEVTHRLTKCLSGSIPPVYNWHMSYPYWGTPRDILSSDTTASAEGGIVGALFHVSTHEYCHTSIYMASSQLDHVSLLSSLLEQPSRHLETSCLDHLRHRADHISLAVPNSLWYVRRWLSDTGMTNETFSISMFISVEWHVLSQTFNGIKDTTCCIMMCRLM